MKIKYAILSNDGNELYNNFWEINKRLWYENMDVIPILVDICNENNLIEKKDYIILKIKKIPHINTGFQAQISRLFVTQYFPDDILITSDIDMFPLSKEYFVNGVMNLDSEKMVIYSSDAYKKSEVRYPMCYNAAKGKLFAEILELDDDFSNFTINLKNRNWGWDTDEKYLGMKINQNIEKCILLERGWKNGVAKKRIDRVKWEYSEKEIINGNYIDSHSLRPYIKYKDEINKLTDYYFKNE